MGLWDFVLFGFCLFEKKLLSSRLINFLISRRACAVFCWSWTFEASCWAFVAHVGAVVTGANFVKLNYRGYILVSEVRFRGILLLGFRSFLFERHKGKCFVGLARLIVLFRVGRDQLFVVFQLSGFPVGLPQFFVRAVVTGDYFCWDRAIEFVVCFVLGLRNFCVGVSLPGSPICWAFAVFLLERHGGKFFVELEPLIVLFHVGLDFFFLFHVRRSHWRHFVEKKQSLNHIEPPIASKPR